MKTIIANNITWLDIEKPSQKDLDQLKEKFNLHPFIVQQFLPAIHRPKIEEYLYPAPSKEERCWAGQLFMVLRFPVFNKKKQQTKPVELDFIVTPNTLITSHTGSIPELKTFLNDCQVQKYHQEQYFKSSGHLLFNIVDWLIDACLPMLDHISQRIEQIEGKVFRGKEKEMLSKIALVKKDLIDFNQAVKPQGSVLEVLGKKSQRLFSKDIKPLSQEVIGSYTRVWNVLENNHEWINSIEQTNNSLLSHKLNDIVKFLTVLSFITFPLSVIVGFFGMNVFDNIPIVRKTLYAWLVILIGMSIITGLMVIYFKKKKWL